MSRAQDTTEAIDEDSSEDGRVRRGALNRERIVSAVIELVRAGNHRPTAEQVADRAGVGTRTVFRHFDDMDRLFSEINAVVHREITTKVGPLARAVGAAGSLEDRILAVASARAELFETGGPFMRAARTNRWRSPVLSDFHRETVGHLREALHSSLPELNGLPAADRRAAEMATSFEAWNQLREDQGASPAEATASLAAALLALLTPR